MKIRVLLFILVLVSVIGLSFDAIATPYYEFDTTNFYPGDIGEDSQPTISISGCPSYGVTFGIYDDSSCTNLAFVPSAPIMCIAPPDPFLVTTTKTLTTTGIYNYYIKFNGACDINSTHYLNNSAPLKYYYLNPTMELDPVQTPNYTDTTPTILIHSALPNSILELFKDSSCSQSVSSTANASSTGEASITTNHILTALNFYLKVKRNLTDDGYCIQNHVLFYPLNSALVTMSRINPTGSRSNTVLNPKFRISNINTMAGQVIKLKAKNTSTNIISTSANHTITSIEANDGYVDITFSPSLTCSASVCIFSIYPNINANDHYYVALDYIYDIATPSINSLTYTINGQLNSQYNTNNGNVTISLNQIWQDDVYTFYFYANNNCSGTESSIAISNFQSSITTNIDLAFDGTYQFSYKAKDSAGNNSSPTCRIFTNPIIAGSNINMTIDRVSPNISNINIQKSVNGVLQNANGLWSDTVSITANSTDNSYILSTATKLNMNRTYNNVVYNAQFNLNCTNNAQNTSSNCSLSLDTLNNSQFLDQFKYIPNQSSTPILLSSNAGVNSNGSYNFTLSTLDNFGNSYTSASYSAVISNDFVSPVISFNSPPENATLNGNPTCILATGTAFPVQLQLSDDTGGNKTMFVFMNENQASLPSAFSNANCPISGSTTLQGISTINIFQSGNVSNGLFSTSLNTISKANNIYYLRAVACDSAGHMSVAHDSCLKIANAVNDTAIPTGLAFNSTPTTASGNNFILTAKVFDDVQIAKVELYKNGALYMVSSVPQDFTPNAGDPWKYDFKINTLTLPNGSATFALRACDTSNNCTSLTASIIVTIQNADLILQAENYTPIAGLVFPIATSAATGSPIVISFPVGTSKFNWITYTVQPRFAANNDYYVYVRLRAKDSNLPTGLKISLDNGLTFTNMSYRKNNTFKWCRYQVNATTARKFKFDPANPKSVQFKFNNSNLEVDKISILPADATSINLQNQ